MEDLRKNIEKYNPGGRYKQYGYTELSGIPPDLGEKQIFNLGESPISGGIPFFQSLIWHGSLSDRKECLLENFCFGI